MWTARNFPFAPSMGSNLNLIYLWILTYSSLDVTANTKLSSVSSF